MDNAQKKKSCIADYEIPTCRWTIGEAYNYFLYLLKLQEQREHQSDWTLDVSLYQKIKSEL